MRMPSRDDWVATGLDALAAAGEGAIRVDPLAARLGVTKGSFHHHFRGAADLRRAVLAAHELAQLELVERVRDDVAGLDASAALDRLGDLIGRLPDDRLERAVRSWAAIDADAEGVQARVDAARLTAIEALWLQVVPPQHARTAALVPLLAMIGASASSVATRADLDAVLRMLAGLARHVPAVIREW
ncbi:TetR/AcrR family transcriptional regulator [Agrococcus citreus]|uniref:TetR/AcrR family transcriptional regulator n=2 Tax=Agrococcus citreus TaxID=84643 RepID=A0ABP4JQU4_9MICO